MRRPVLPRLRTSLGTSLLGAALAIALAGPAHASSALLNAARSVPAASSRATAAELRAAQASVDAALQTRKQRYEAWQRAAKAKERGAADVAAKKRAGVAGAPLERSLQKTLVLDEEAARARSALLAAEAEVARRGAALLGHYDALLVERRRAVEALPAQSAARGSAAQAYKDLSAQRDAVRAALLPVLSAHPQPGAAVAQGAALPKNLDLDPRADDDVETLLEKADLARDLEARFLRQAEAVRKRIAELEEEQAVAREVSGMIGRSQLFDEEDRRLVVLRADTPNAPNAPAAGAGGGDAQRGDDGTQFEGAPAELDTSPAPPPAGNNPGAPPSLAFTGPSADGGGALVRTEQSLGTAQTDAAMSGLLSSSTANLQALRALEAQLKSQAGALRAKSKKLTTEAKTRAE